MSDSRLKHLLDETNKMLTNNRKYVSLDKLASVVQALIDEGEESEGATVGQLAALQNASDISKYEQHHEWNRRMVDSCVILGSLALKSSILINGGAAVAMLAYLGKLPAGSDYGTFPHAMVLFVLGVLLSAIATGTGYLAQFSWSHDKNLLGNTIVFITILLLLGSYFNFGFGGYITFLEFTNP